MTVYSADLDRDKLNAFESIKETAKQMMVRFDCINKIK